MSNTTVDNTGFDHKAFLKNTSSLPGVYRMFDQQGEILYVGKAQNLKKRLTSYFRSTGLSAKTQSLVKLIQHIEVTITHTEGEALLLESNLIKDDSARAWQTGLASGLQNSGQSAAIGRRGLG